MIAVVIWCFLVAMFAWFGKDTGPKRVFKGIGYATLTMIIPVVLILAGIWGWDSYQASERAARYAEEEHKTGEYERCVESSKAQSARAIEDLKTGERSALIGRPVTDVNLLRELNGCP